jgi:hypothetical protein
MGRIEVSGGGITMVGMVQDPSELETVTVT